MLQDQDRYSRIQGIRWSAVPLIVGFMCSCFVTTASFVLILLLQLNPDKMDSTLFLNTLIKGVFFFVITLGLGILLYNGRRTFRFVRIHPHPKTLSKKTRPFFCLVIMMFLLAFFLFPRLNAYPWIAPDEAHHLSVAKNLALHQVYASGNPESGYRFFDTYDSVGVPVIGPVAIAFKLFGATPAVARGIVAVYYLFLCIGMYYLFLPSGTIAVTSGILFATFGYGTIYLGRTLYGEIPALAFLVWGLIAWRQAMFCKPHFWSLVAGLAFGLAILCKTILIMSAFAFLAVLFWDCMTDRRLRLPHLLWPAMGVVAVLGIWAIIQRLATHDTVPPPRDTLGLYQHYLMFGWRSPLNAFARFGSEPLQTFLLFACLFYGLFLFMQQTGDPARNMLVFMSVFYLFWWLFFTPCQIYRYSWWSYWIGGCLGGLLLGNLADGLTEMGRLKKLAGTGCLLLLFCVSLIPNAVQETRRVCFADEMHDEYAVVLYLEQNPPFKHLMTTYYPLGMTLGYLCQRKVETVEVLPEKIPPETLVIVNCHEQAALLRTHQPERVLGRYALLKGGMANDR